MSDTSSGPTPTRRPGVEDAPAAVTDLRAWSGLLGTGSAAALVSVGLIVVQVAVFVTWPPPTTTIDFFRLLQENPVLGLVSLDLLYVVNNVAVLLLYLALAAVLWSVSRSAVSVALALGVLGMAAYTASIRAVEMLDLARAHATAGPAARAALLATGDGMLATWQGTAFDVYYMLNAAALGILATLMHRTQPFGRATARWGLAAAGLMLVPSTFGLVGMMFALASLVPWSVFAVLVALRLRRLAGPRRPPGSPARRIA